MLLMCWFWRWLMWFVLRLVMCFCLFFWWWVVLWCLLGCCCCILIFCLNLIIFIWFVIVIWCRVVWRCIGVLCCVNWWRIVLCLYLMIFLMKVRWWLWFVIVFLRWVCSVLCWLCCVRRCLWRWNCCIWIFVVFWCWIVMCLVVGWMWRVIGVICWWFVCWLWMFDCCFVCYINRKWCVGFLVCCFFLLIVCLCYGCNWCMNVWMFVSSILIEIVMSMRFISCLNVVMVCLLSYVWIFLVSISVIV